MAPILVRYNLPMDALEGSIWGQNLEWGYDKNPYLNGWLTHLAVFFTPQGQATYLFSQLSVILCFWAIWQLAKRWLTPAYAFIAVIILEAMQYYNFHAIDFNDNTLELSLWMLTVLNFYLALTSTSEKSFFPWFFTGLSAALGLMAKYYTGLLLLTMAIFFFKHTPYQHHMKAPAFWLGLMVFLLLTLPHLAWLFSHDFITVDYVFQRVDGPVSWINHLKNPLIFAYEQLQVFLPAGFILLSLCLGKKPYQSVNRLALPHFEKTFLYYMALLPFFLTLLLSFVFGIKLRAGWGMPLLSLWGVLAIYWLQPRLSTLKLCVFSVSMFLFTLLLLIGYLLSLSFFPNTSSANYPGETIAETINREWYARYHTPLQYVAGYRWVSGNISFYTHDHPQVFMEWNVKHAPTIDVNDLIKKGAVFVWDESLNETLPDAVKLAFPNLSEKNIFHFKWRRHQEVLPSIKIAVAYLPPAEQQS